MVLLRGGKKKDSKCLDEIRKILAEVYGCTNIK